MNNEKLLESIGYVKEEFLMETENGTHRSGVRLSRMALVAAIVAVFAITAMASTNFLAGFLKAEDNGSSPSNLSTGMGRFVYAEEGIYYGAPGYIYKCDFAGNILKTYPLGDKTEIPYYMFGTEDALVYVSSTENGDRSWELRMQPKDGSEAVSICSGVGATSAYADGDKLYVTKGGTMLTRVDLMTMEQTELLENVSAYFVDEDYIYAVQGSEESCYFRSPKDVVKFERSELEFCPNKIIADGEDLYICRWLDEAEQETTGKRYQVHLIREGESTALPVYSWFYQILNGSVLYLEKETYSLKSYNIGSGETTTLAENVFEFAVLEDRYVCIERFNQDPLIYDWQTREEMQIPVDLQP